jgi:DNA-binding GntR family transcriptional regulator
LHLSHFFGIIALGNSDGSEARVKLTKVKLERASDLVFNLLHESILDQTFRPGQRLNVRELAEKMDVSLTPVKDAITRLAVEGLIELRPRNGTYVSHLSIEELADTLSVRRALECLAAELLIPNLTEEDLEWFETETALLDQPIKSERDRRQHERRNNDLHLRLVELSGNKKLIEIYRSLNAHMKIARIHYTTNTWSKRLNDERKEHHKILEALQARNGRLLRDALDEHIRRASAALTHDLCRSGISEK